MNRLDKKTIRMLQLLDKQILLCKECELQFAFVEVRCKPWWTPNSRYVIVGEAPGAQEVKEQKPFVGQAGIILWRNIEYVMGLDRDSFAVINSVNCRPVRNNRNSKPTLTQQKACYPWVRKFIKLIKPEKVLILGNYAAGTMIGKNIGITHLNGTTGKLQINNIPYTLGVHPAYALYNQAEGEKKLRIAIEAFKKMEARKTMSYIPEELFEI